MLIDIIKQLHERKLQKNKNTTQKTKKMNNTDPMKNRR
jgi:hypothetical protein